MYYFLLFKKTRVLREKGAKNTYLAFIEDFDVGQTTSTLVSCNNNQIIKITN